MVPDDPPITPQLSATHLRLLDAAATLFRRKGYEGTSIREIAALVGIQNASMYHHIRSKADLLYTLSVESLTRITAVSEQAVESRDEPLDRLRALIVAHLETSLADQDRHATMLMELRSLSADQREEVVDRRDRYERLIERVVADAQAAGDVRSDFSPRLLTLALLNLLNWTIFWYRPDGDLDIGEIASTFASIYLEGAVAR